MLAIPQYSNINTWFSLPVEMVSRVWPLLHADSYLEPQVRAGCQVGTKVDELLLGVRLLPHQRYYPSLTTPYSKAWISASFSSHAGGKTGLEGPNTFNAAVWTVLRNRSQSLSASSSIRSSFSRSSARSSVMRLFFSFDTLILLRALQPCGRLFGMIRSFILDTMSL